MSIAHFIDHTLLSPTATDRDIRKLCQEARQMGFASVCVNPCYVPLCANILRDVPVAICTVIGFPLGASSTAVKAFSARVAAEEGATELDMVMNIGALKSGRDADVRLDIEAVVEAAKPEGVVKVIIEACLLTDEEKARACRLAKEAGADFVKTSTGFSTGGATVHDVELMRRTVGEDMGVKASGGIRDYATAQAMILAGASRLGCSAGAAILQQEREIEGLR